MVLLLLQAMISSPGIVCETDDFTTSQIVSWSDDFEDGNYDDWITFGGAYQGEELPSNFTIIDGALFGQEESFNHAFHDSEVITGTWSVDLYVINRDDHEVSITFISKNYTLQDGDTDGYYVSLFPGPHGYWENDGLNLAQSKAFDFHYAATGEINGWQHLDITRDNYGQVCVYLNDTFYVSAIYNEVTESTIFGFSGWGGTGFDNVTVTNNVITIDKAPPYWIPEPPSDVSIQVNEPLTYKLNATDTSGIDSFWVNDTAHFEIDNHGILTNTATLDIGTYGIQVSVNDTNGYTLSNSFSVIVLGPEIAPIPTEWIFIGIVGIIGVIAIVVVIRLRKV